MNTYLRDVLLEKKAVLAPLTLVGGGLALGMAGLGAYDTIKSGLGAIKNTAQGNFGQAAKDAAWTGLNGLMFIPGVGWAGKTLGQGLKAAGAISKGSRVASTAGKAAETLEPTWNWTRKSGISDINRLPHHALTNIGYASPEASSWMRRTGRNMLSNNTPVGKVIEKADWFNKVSPYISFPTYIGAPIAARSVLGDPSYMQEEGQNNASTTV